MNTHRHSVSNIITGYKAITFIVNNSVETYPNDVDVDVIRDGEELTIPVNHVILGDVVLRVTNFGDYQND